MIYEIKGYHQKPAYVKGDLESEVVMIYSESFSTRKQANAVLEQKNAEAKRKGQKTFIKIVKRGKEQSTLRIYTGYTWKHENSGEEIAEFYYYVVNQK